jgi:hypothetical protein
VEGTALWEQMWVPNLILNIPRRNEDVTTDMLFSSAPANDIGGCVAAQFFMGCKSRFRSVMLLKDSDADFPSALMEEIRKHGAINRLISDSTKTEVSARVKEILSTLVIGDWQSEPHNQHQNPAERGWTDTQEWSNIQLNIFGRSLGTPPLISMDQTVLTSLESTPRSAALPHLSKLMLCGFT